MAETANVEGAEKRKRRSVPAHIGVFCLRSIIVLSAVVTILIAGLGARFGYGPIQINFVARGAQGILSTLAGAEGMARVGTAQIGWNFENGFVIAIKNVVVAGPSATATVPAVVIDLDDLALLTGSLKARSISIEQPSVELAPLGAARSAGPEPIALLEMLNERLRRIAELARQRGLETFTVSSGQLQVPRSAPNAPPLVFDGIDVTVNARDGGFIQGTMRAWVDAQLWSASFDRSARDSGFQLKMSADGIGLAEALGVDTISADLTVAPKVDARFDANGKAVAATGTLNVGAGYIRIGPDGTRLKRAGIALTWRPEHDDFALTPSPILFGNSEVVVAGTINAPDPTDARWRFSLTMPRALIAPSDIPGPPAVIESATATGYFDAAAQILDIPKITAKAGASYAEGDAKFDFTPGGPRGWINGHATDVSYDTFVRLWPSFVVPPARKWLLENIFGGHISTASMKIVANAIDFKGDPTIPNPTQVPAISSVVFDHAIFKLPGTLPRLTDAVGTVDFRDNKIALDVSSGTVTPPIGGPIAASNITYRTSSVRDRPMHGWLGADLVGSAIAIGSLADDDPINAMKPLGIDPATLSGSAKVTFALDGPMRDVIDPKEIAWQMTADLHDVGSSAPIKDHRIDKANVVVKADNSLMTIKGKADVDGLAATVDLTQPLGKAGALGHSDVTVVLTDADRKARGLDLGGLLTGPIGVTMKGGADGRQTFDVDLTKASLTLPGIGWTKGPGVPAEAVFDFVDKGATRRIENLVVTSDGVDVEGSMQLGPKSELISASFPTFSLRPGDQASVRVDAKKGGYAIKVDAENFDGRGLVNQIKKSGTSDAAGSGSGGKAKASPDIDIKASVGKLVGYRGATLDDVDLTASFAKGGIAALDLSARTGSARSGVTVSVAPKDGGKAITASLGDTGRVLRFLDFYSRMTGGQGTIDAVNAGDKTSGTLQVDNFRIVSEPALAKIYDQAKQAPSLQRAAAETPSPPSSTAFASLDVHFEADASTIHLTDGVLKGPTVGGTAAGTINLKAQTLELAGTFIPIFALNNLFGRIPVLGELLGGGTDGGLIGITFKLSGPITAPALSFNPVSTITPGILRKIFEY
ncbi:hypothetical protein [Segnochrobactrum spirostomi]|uniref:DUF3971 domain-containing protein n=1 Tax=Segnochrobactrum spirostomi TaxID=2608987 RepID=A0A6A7Y4P0_9HYPH|nr:hypothetical protein [Segnochrobactrum spirostomi]MQT14113.1 hypothetical protein [Segnochrobactrum spirostomi]